MEFRIADTFTASLASLTGDEQKAVKTTAFDLQLNPEQPGHQFHRLDRAKDRNFWSVRVNRDIRIIVHRTGSSLLLCYVGHHDDAYAWAERRKLETHPTTGAAQLVEIRERVHEIEIPTYVPAAGEPELFPPLFDGRSEEELLRYGVPPEWVPEVLAATEDTVLEIADHLPAEAAEALLRLAVGQEPAVPAMAAEDPFEHPDALRRFRVIEGIEELARALEYPWDRWSVFLHPSQRETVEKDYSGPARVSGSAGTGKTVVALHRAAYLARTNPDARVLLATFSEPLAALLRINLRRLVQGEPALAERLEVHGLDTIALRLYQRNFGKPELASHDEVRDLLVEAAAAEGEDRFREAFLVAEWEDVVDAWQLRTWEAYRDVARLGRKTRLPEARRQELWRLFELLRAGLEEPERITRADVYSRLAEHYAGGAPPPFEFVVVDEAQDLSVPQLRFLAALVGDKPNGLICAGDLGQRIFQTPFSWKSLGVDVRGRAKILRVNYRTSHQIRSHADRLLPGAVSDVDGNVDDRSGTVSVFNGPQPTIALFDTAEAEIDTGGEWLRTRLDEGIEPHEVGVFVRSKDQLNRGIEAVTLAGPPYVVLDEKLEMLSGSMCVCTMHLAKGLEFRAVVVMACDDDVIPLQARIDEIGDDADLEEVYETERHLLYVACTRAREHLLATGTTPGSEFLEDLRQATVSGSPR
jgi:superfamily I DNA/RNA helicase